MTPEQMSALVPHPGWDDGREGFVFCRFDAVLDERPDFRLRAEVTWLDGRELPPDRRHTMYYDPELFLEVESPDGSGKWATRRFHIRSLTDAEAVCIVQADPRYLLSDTFFLSPSKEQTCTA